MNALIINFKEVFNIIPESGDLTLKFARTKDGKMVASYMPKYNGKFDEKAIRPCTVLGTPEELNENWAKEIRELSAAEKDFTNDSFKNRKAELQKAKESRDAVTAAKAKTTTASGATASAPAKSVVTKPGLFSNSGTSCIVEETIDPTTVGLKTEDELLVDPILPKTATEDAGIEKTEGKETTKAPTDLQLEF